RGSLGRRKVFDGSADVEEDGRLPEMPGGHHRTVRGQVGLASEFEVECFEVSRSLQKEQSSIIAVAEDHGNVAAKQCGSCGLDPVELVRLRHGQELLRRLELSCLKAQFRRGERALRSPTWVGCQSYGALQERGGSSDASPRLR